MKFSEKYDLMHITYINNIEFRIKTEVLVV